MKKNTIVVFGKDGARVHKGIKPSDWQGVPNVLVNPDLSQLAGIPPHRWQLKGSEIVELPPTPGGQEPTPGSVIIEHRIEVSAWHRFGHLWISALTAAVISLAIRFLG